MKLQTFLNVTRPLICTVAATGLAFSGKTQLTPVKTAIVALIIYPSAAHVGNKSLSNSSSQKLKDRLNKIVDFGLAVALGTGGWIAIQSEVIANIVLFALDLFFHLHIPLVVYDKASLFLLSCAGVFVITVNVVLAVMAYQDNCSHAPFLK